MSEWIPRPVAKPERRVKRVTRPGKGQRAQRSGGHLFAQLVSPSRRAFIRRQRCIATGAKTGEPIVVRDWMPETLRALCPYVARVVVAHVKSRGSKGADVANMIPLDWKVHEWAGQIGWREFVRRLGLMPPTEIAAEFETKYEARRRAIAKRLEA